MPKRWLPFTPLTSLPPSSLPVTWIFVCCLSTKVPTVLFIKCSTLPSRSSVGVTILALEVVSDLTHCCSSFLFSRTYVRNGAVGFLFFRILQLSGGIFSYTPEPHIAFCPIFVHPPFSRVEIIADVLRGFLLLENAALTGSEHVFVFGVAGKSYAYNHIANALRETWGNDERLRSHDSALSQQLQSGHLAGGVHWSAENNEWTEADYDCEESLDPWSSE